MERYGGAVPKIRLLSNPGMRVQRDYFRTADATRRVWAEQALRWENGWPRDLVGKLPVVVFALDEDGTFILSEGGGLSALGLRPQELVGLSVFQVYKNAPQVLGNVRKAMSGQAFSAVVEVSGATFECWYEPSSDERGNVRRVEGFAVDITERRRAERSLTKNEERFGLLAKATGEAIWDNDLLTGVQEWDGATEALFGYPPRRAKTGQWWEERIHPDDRQRVLSGLERFLKGGGGTWFERYRFRRADGSYAHVADRGHTVRDPTGRPMRMVGSMKDVSEETHRIEQIKESERRYRIAFESAAVGIAHIAPDGRWLRVNDKLLEISGYGREELLGLTFLEVTLPEDRPDSKRRFERVLSGDLGPYSHERRFLRKDASRVWVALSVSVARDPSGLPEYLVCVAEDITARKLAELVSDPLTPLEEVILRRVVAGRKNRQMAEELRYSTSTIKRHVRSIMAKLGVADRRKAALRAVEIGLLPPSPY